MDTLLDWLPLLCFFAAYQVWDLYAATLAVMLAVSVQSLWLRLRHGSLSGMRWLALATVLIFGAATLLFRDARFIQGKPSVLYLLMALLFLGNRLRGGEPLTGRLLKEHIILPGERFALLDLSWAALFLILSALNLLVAWRFEEAVWVQFKVFVLPGITLVFTVLQGLAMWRWQKAGEEGGG
ncbi:MAG: septation protein IspZ [Magnetococcales bacterium]|nr:septation protein IspZ [Magnetococcales bacterium]